MAGQGKQIREQRGLSWIRPQMMQQVLSSIELSQEKRAETQMELLNLFPESRTPLEQERIASSCPPFADEVTDSRSVSQSPTQLTIFYNGAVKVYHVSADKAEALMKLADSNNLSERATLKPSHGENQQSREEVTAGLPMTRKLALQRFLQKRNDRLGSLTPYTSTDKKTSSKGWAKEEEDEDEDEKTSSKGWVKKEDEDEDEKQQISLSLSFPSQRCG